MENVNAVDGEYTWQLGMTHLAYVQSSIQITFRSSYRNNELIKKKCIFNLHALTYNFSLKFTLKSNY